LTAWNIKRNKYGKPDKLPDFMDPDLIENAAGAWAESCNMFVCRYSQMGMMTMCSNGKMGQKSNEKTRAKWIDSLNVAYSDVKDAFQNYLANKPADRPFFIAAHSQGSFCAAKLISECVEGTDHMQAFIAGYLAGGYVPADMFGPVFKEAHVCEGPEDTKCIMSWDTRVKGQWEPHMMNDGMLGIQVHTAYWLMFDKYCEEPPMVDDEQGKDRVQINPATWTHEGGGEHLGIKLSNSTEPAMGPEGYGSGTEVNGNAVLIEDPKSWYGKEYPGSAPNFHPKDIQFWFFNIKANVAVRLAAFLAANPPQETAPSAPETE